MIQSFQNLQFSIFVFFILKNSLYCNSLQRLFVPCLMNNAKSTISYFIFTHITSSSNQSTRLLHFSLLFFFLMQRQRRLVTFVSKNFVNRHSVSLCENLPIFDLSIKFCGALFESDRFDRSLLFKIQSFAFVIEFTILSQWYFWFSICIQTDFFGIFIGFSTNTTCTVLLRRSDFNFEVGYHLNDHYYNSIQESYCIIIIKMESTAQPINYLKCNKTGLHEQQNLNIVCLQTSCLENLACCCACIETQHKKHKTRPLKMVMNEVRTQTATSKPHKINIDIMLDIAKQHERATFELFHKNKREIIANLENIELALKGYYNYTIDQILLKNSDGNLVIEQALSRASNPKTLQELKLTIKKLVAVLPQSTQKDKDLTEQELKLSLQENTGNIQKSINTSMSQVNTKLSKYQASVMYLINNTNLWQTKFKFSPIYKHPDVNVLAENRVKACNSSGYKFAIMEPGVGKAANKTFSFLIKQSTSNWLALGFCHKKVVESKAYSFSFGSIGHGAYMMSANGGSWSHTKTEYNNTVKAIKFVKGDVVHVSIDHSTEKILFTKNKSAEKYELPFVYDQKDELHPCVLFYYINDQVEYLGNTKKD